MVTRTTGNSLFFRISDLLGLRDIAFGLFYRLRSPRPFSTLLFSLSISEAFQHED